MKYEKDYINKHEIIPFEMQLKGVYILGNSGKKYAVEKINSNVEIWLELITANILHINELKTIDGKFKAQVASIKVGKDKLANIVFNKNNELSFFDRDENNIPRKMQVLIKYDIKEGKFEY